MESTQLGTAIALEIEPTLSASEIDQARDYLFQTRNYLTGATNGLSEAQWTFKPGPDGWSIAEIVEHVIFVQERVLGPVRDELVRAPGGPGNRQCSLVDEIVLGKFPSRLAKFKAPEVLHPRGDLGQCEAAERVALNTRLFIEYLESTPDLRHHVLDSPPLKAVTKCEHQILDGYQWILAATAHTERHTKQILEVKADPRFPHN